MDLKGGVICVTENRTATKGGATDGSTKTVGSKRELPMPPLLVEVFKRAKKRQAAQRLKAGERYRDRGYVTADRRGNPHHPDTFSDKWAEAVAAAGLPAVTLHGGRHTALTMLHLEGVPLAVIAAWAGHKDASFTLRRYAHNQTGQLDAAASAWERIVRASAREAESGDGQNQP